jgi:hypothetical protein
MIQVDFKDQTRILMSIEYKTIYYMTATGERSAYPIATAMESDNPEFTKRLKCAKELLTQMMPH